MRTGRVASVIPALMLQLASALLAAAPAAPPGQDDADRPSSGQPTPLAYLTTELVSTGTFSYEVELSVFFIPDSTQSDQSAEIRLPAGLSAAGNPRKRAAQVALLVTGVPPGAARLQACLDDACRPLDASFGVPLQGKSVRISFDGPNARPGPRAAEEIRLQAPAAWVSIRTATGTRPSPALSVSFPPLGETEQQFLRARPVLHVQVGAVAKDRQSQLPAATTLNFDGGVGRARRQSLLGLSYSGQVATDKRITFNQLKADLEWRLNLYPTDYLPLRVAAGVETDQGFDIKNLVGGMSLSYLLPFNVNFSPPGNDYIISSSPWLGVRFELGRKMNSDTMDPADVAAPERFLRGGYELRWKLPLARRTVVHLHHAGEWVKPEGGARTFHKLWDLALEAGIGDVTYYLGYQRGEAAPLYQPIETASAGITLRFK